MIFIIKNRLLIIYLSFLTRLKSKGNVKSLSGIILYYSLYLFKDYFDSKGKYYIDNLKQRSFGANLYYANNIPMSRKHTSFNVFSFG